MDKFNLKSNFHPTGDQPQAIDQLVAGINRGQNHQVLLGVTGSGKTFTMANVIQQTQLPTLIISHNKTLAAQLYQEFRDFFPDNAVSYFVSYYDYYQPEAYIPSTDTYIEKETNINEEIDKLRLSTTTNLLTRPDVIVIASVSCIYNLGSPVEYGKYILEITKGQIVSRDSIFKRLIDLQYDRTTTDLHRGSFRIRGDTVQLWPAYTDYALKLTLLDNLIEDITPIDPITGNTISINSGVKGSQHKTPGFDIKPDQKTFVIYPAKHYLTDPKSQQQAFKQIRADLKQRLKHFEDRGKPVEAHRIKQKVQYDLEMIQEFGFVNGIENYSRYFDGRKVGDPPFTLLDYMRHNAEQFHNQRTKRYPLDAKRSFLTIIDESHITNPQIRGMHTGDQSRKQTLIDFGFRLPAALDNRPLTQTEFLRRLGPTIHTSATPNDWEISLAQKSCGWRTQGDPQKLPAAKKEPVPKNKLSQPLAMPFLGESVRQDPHNGPQPNLGVVQQLIRPTGLLDPHIDIRPSQGQINNLVVEIIKRLKLGQRTLVTTLTKRMAEDLTEFLNNEQKITELFEDTTKMVILPKVAYLHSDIDTLDRSDILDDLRKGKYDVLVGINLLREGLDLPEVSLVAILDADKEGFLRSTTSLIQVMGRAARHVDGQVIMYADTVTGSMQAAIDEVNRRRDIQIAYNQKHHLTPQSIEKPIREVLIKRDKKSRGVKKTVIQLSKKEAVDLDTISPDALTPADKKKLIRGLTRRMNAAAKELDFELAALLRDKISELEMT